MQVDNIKKILQEVQNNKLSIENALEQLKEFPFKDLGHTKLDTHRELRSGFPEVIYCEGKTKKQIASIIKHMNKSGNNILATRANKKLYKKIKKRFPEAKYNKPGKVITIKKQKIKDKDSYIAIVTAGTSDIPVAEEAAETAKILGNKVEKIFDVGVAGIHRLYGKIKLIRGARVIIVIAGMEGALASVVGGLVDKPVIAVPTSIGYGASFGGVSALLGMLTSCANGISVVNINNGFGAGYLASMINKL